MPTLALGLAILTMPQAKPLPPLLQGVRRIVCLGDSITQFGDDPGGYVWLLRENLAAIYPEAEVEVVNAGISGNKSTDMLARFQRDVLDRRPGLLTLSVGVNDVWHGFYDHPKGDGPLGVKLEEYRRNVDRMVADALAAGVRVVIMEATPIGEDVKNDLNRKQEAYNRALQGIARRRGLKFVAYSKPFRAAIRAYRENTGSTQDILTTDGVHMNGAGYQVMAQCLLTTLGVSDAERLAALPTISKRSKPEEAKVKVPTGWVVSDHCSASASTSTDGYPAANATLPYSAGGPDRWCAAGGEFEPNPWWQVDLGLVRHLTGVQLFFAPKQPDTWRYRVETSTDGEDYSVLADNRSNDMRINQAVHEGEVEARFVRVVFTSPTAGLNWASLHRVLVFARNPGG